MLAVLIGSPSSFITQPHFEFSNYTQAEYFTRDKSTSCLENGTFLSCFLTACFTGITLIITQPYALRFRIHFSVSVCACMLKEEDKWSFCLLGWIVHQMCWFAKIKTKTVYQRFVGCCADRMQMLLDISNVLTGTWRLKTWGLLTSLNSNPLLMDVVVTELLLRAFHSPYHYFSCFYSIILHFLFGSLLYNLSSIQHFPFPVYPLAYYTLASFFVFCLFLSPSSTISCDVTTSRCWSMWSSFWASWEERWRERMQIQPWMKILNPVAMMMRRMQKHPWNTDRTSLLGFCDFTFLPSCLSVVLMKSQRVPFFKWFSSPTCLSTIKSEIHWYAQKSGIKSSSLLNLFQPVV